MNDRYLYKAKRKDSGEWVQGNLVQSCLIVHMHIVRYKHRIPYVGRCTLNSNIRVVFFKA